MRGVGKQLHRRVEEGKEGALEKRQVVITGALEELNKVDRIYMSDVDKVYLDVDQSRDGIRYDPADYDH